MLPLSAAWTCETGLLLEAGILKLWDTTVSGTSGASTDTVCSFLPQDGPEGPISGTGYYTSAFSVTNKSERLQYGSRKRSGATDRHFRDPGRVYAIVQQIEPTEQSVI